MLKRKPGTNVPKHVKTRVSNAGIADDIDARELDDVLHADESVGEHGDRVARQRTPTERIIPNSGSDKKRRK